MTKVDDFLSQLYKADRNDRTRRAFSSWWVGPAEFIHGRVEKIARFPTKHSTDGYDVEVFATRMPAEFFRLDVRSPRTSAVVATISTGTVEPAFVAQLASLISSGLIDVQGGR